ncbi:MAG: response regulator, partial [Moraxellaceae bacterium]
LLATILRNSNYRVDIAYTGRTALERLTQYAYQAVTIDLKLPDTDGIQLIQQLRKDAATHSLPIVVISASLDDERLITRQDPTFADVQWLQKPLDPNALIAAIKIAIATKH